MADESKKLPAGQQVSLPGHFDTPVILEAARPLAKGFECRVRLPNGTLEEAVISPEECALLTKAYLFLRDVENKLQMVNDAQTHSLPRTHEELTTCARLLGYPAAEPFLRDYQNHTGQVNHIFESIDLILSRQR